MSLHLTPINDPAMASSVAKAALERGSQVVLLEFPAPSPPPDAVTHGRPRKRLRMGSVIESLRLD